MAVQTAYRALAAIRRKAHSGQSYRSKMRANRHFCSFATSSTEVVLNSSFLN